MSRRPPTPPVNRVDRARSRMAPGGRMWSESPIRYPRKRTAVTGVPDPFVPPTAAQITEVYTNGGLTATLPSLSGVTSAVAVLCSVGGSTLMTVPDGWRTIINASSGATISLHTALYYSVIAIDAVAGTESLGVSFEPAAGGKHSYVRGYAAYFTGGSGGTWAAAVGGIVSGTDVHVQFKTPASRPWFQSGALRDVYSLPGSEPIPSGVDMMTGPAGAYGYPSPGTYAGSAFTDLFLEPSQYDESDYVTFNDGYERAIGVPIAVWQQ